VDASRAHRPLPSGGSRASWRSRETSRTVTPLAHHSTASRSDRPSSMVIVCSASPARLSASRTAASRSPSAIRTATAKPSSGVPGRHVPCAVPPGHLTLSAAPPASPTADSSHLPYRHQSFIDTGLSLGPKQLPTSQAVTATDRVCFTYPLLISKFDVRHTFCILGCSMRAGAVPGPGTSSGRLNLLLPTGW
jgi:hypothetical protein